MNGPWVPEIAACVRGPAKQWLAGLAPGPRLDVLDSLARALGVSLPAPHYLDLDGLRRLRHLGWRVGGHGVEHRRLGDCDEATLTRELCESRQLLAAIGEEGPLLFAYPDGSWNELVVGSTAAAGFALACTVQRAPWTDPRERFTVPRVFCRGDAVVLELLVSR